MKYKVAAIQMTIVQEDKETNIKKALEMYDEAVANGAKVIVFPEYFLTFPVHVGQTQEFVNDVLAETIPGPMTDKIAAKCVETNTYCVAGSMVEKCADGKLRNTCAIIGPDGKIIGKYSKVHPENAPAKHEPGRQIWPGMELPIFDTPLGKWAVMIDMDLSCPEMARSYGVRGADVIFAPVCWSAKFNPVIETFTKASALYSLAYVVSANPVGWRRQIPVHAWAFAAKSQNEANHTDLPYGGASCIALGVNVIGRGVNFVESIAYATIDSEGPQKSRDNDASIYPFWRRPDLYGALVDPKTNQPYGTHVKHDVPVHI